MEKLHLQASDGYLITAHLFRPAQSNNKLLLVNSATGVRQQVYISFSKYLAELGFTVVTYDYRGIGQSKPENMRNFEANMRIWGTHDFKAVTIYLKKHFSHYRKFCLGHSVGALILGFNDDSLIFEKFIFVGTQDAYVKNLPLKVAVTASLGFGFAVPLSVFFLGYFPAQHFGLGESLPAGSAMDWRTLILHRKSTSRLYEKVKNDYTKELKQQVFILYAEDDPWVKMKGMESLMDTAYPNMQKTYRKILISESPEKKIGHINYFRSYNQPLWKIITDQLI